jgi:acetylacetone-cleaving enzyme
MLKQRVNDEFIPTKSIGWREFPQEFHSGGVQWKLLRVSPETAAWTVLFRGPAGSAFRPHIHHGPAEGFVFCGKVGVRDMYAEGPGFVYEAAGARHEKTTVIEDTEFLLTMSGPLTWVMPSGEKRVVGWEDAQQIWEQQQTQAAG